MLFFEGKVNEKGIIVSVPFNVGEEIGMTEFFAKFAQACSELTEKVLFN
jgi:hypothetical protein